MKWRAALLTLFLVGCQTEVKKVEIKKIIEPTVACTLTGEPPLIVAHRGASGYVPEHTLPAYEVAIKMGADFVEPDLVMTKDGYLIARHENEISETTDVAKKYPKRKAIKTIDGEVKTGWFTEDFTLAEIKSLRAKERLEYRSHEQDGKYEIPTFEEVLVFVSLEQKKRGRTVGIIPEIKHSTYFRERGLAMEEKVITLLKKYDRNTPNSGLIIQSFEIANLKRLRRLTPVPLVQLLDDADKKPYDVVEAGGDLTYAQMATDEGLKAIKEYATWVSPHKSYIVAQTPGASTGVTLETDFIKRAHKVGLKVIAYTFRSDKNILPAAYAGDPKKEYFQFFRLGVDGVFSDFADHAVAAKREFFGLAANACQEGPGEANNPLPVK